VPEFLVPEVNWEPTLILQLYDKIKVDFVFQKLANLTQRFLGHHNSDMVWVRPAPIRLSLKLLPFLRVTSIFLLVTSCGKKALPTNFAVQCLNCSRSQLSERSLCRVNEFLEPLVAGRVIAVSRPDLCLVFALLQVGNPVLQ